MRSAFLHTVSGLTTRLQSFGRVARRSGMKYAFGRVVSRYLYRRHASFLVERSLEPILKKPIRSDAYHIAVIQESDVPSLTKYFAHQKEVFERFLKMGLTGIGVFDASTQEAIAAFWISTKSYYDRDHYKFEFRVRPGQIYQFAGEVAEPFRGSRVAVLALEFAYTLFREKGFSSALACIDEPNDASIRLHRKLGFRFTHRIVFTDLLGVRFASVRPYDDLTEQSTSVTCD